MNSSSPRRPGRGAIEAACAVVVIAIAIGGYSAAGADGPLTQSADWIRDIDFPAVTVPDVDLPTWSIPDILQDKTPWTWRGASAGAVRTVVIDIHPSIYPVSGVEWSVNGQHDRFDLHGPLDEDLGLWHSRTQAFTSGDVITACWQAADGEDYCASVTVS